MVGRQVPEDPGQGEAARPAGPRPPRVPAAGPQEDCEDSRGRSESGHHTGTQGGTEPARAGGGLPIRVSASSFKAGPAAAGAKKGSPANGSLLVTLEIDGGRAQVPGERGPLQRENRGLDCRGGPASQGAGRDRQTFDLKLMPKTYEIVPVAPGSAACRGWICPLGGISSTCGPSRAAAPPSVRCRMTWRCRTIRRWSFFGMSGVLLDVVQCQRVRDAQSGPEALRTRCQARPL